MNISESNNSVAASAGGVTIDNLPLRGAHFRILLNGSMEQITGAALSTLAGIAIPMIKLTTDGARMTSAVQGITGASGLVGIALGAALFGPLSDRTGYARWFRLCALLAVVGSALPLLWPGVATLIVGLFVMGLGIGGGYVLDTDYISELMPTRWKSFMMGVAKAACCIGFIGAAALAWWMLTVNSAASTWPRLLLITGGLGVLTLVMRLRTPGTPAWLLAHGRRADARAAAEYFFGKGVQVQAPPKAVANPTPWRAMFRGKNLLKVIFSGLPWACEGVGVYGVGVFMPILVMALGIDTSHATGMGAVINSVQFTTFINICILPGFVIGLLMVRRVNHARMLGAGFVLSAVGIGVLLAAYLLHWPVWVSVLAFMFFEITLNAGPHLVTFIIPAQIYSVTDRGAGSGIASMLGKAGAILGVFFMPLLLSAGGITLVLAVCIAVMLLGWLITALLGPRVMDEQNNH